MIVDLQINLFRGFSLHGGSFVAPDGSLRYTADASGIITREAASGGGSLQHYSIGNSVVRGRVVDTKGQPVDGAALLKRLLARPVTTLCIDCKSLQEAQERKLRGTS